MTSYWLDEPREPLARVEVSSPDVEIVGGGVTGCACALRLAERGLRVRLHEAREVAGGASGRNGGFALRGGAMPYDAAREQLGHEKARELWELTERALDRMAALAGDALRRVGSLRLEEDRAELEAEYEALREDGFAVAWDDGALLHPEDGSLQPARWVRRLAALAGDAGAEIREGSRVVLDDLEADTVVVATDGLGGELVSGITPTRGQVLVTEPLPKLRWPRPHYARHGYDYWQQLPDRRLVLGGRRDAALETESTDEEAVTEPVQRALDAFLGELARGARVTHRWAGIWGTTDDRLPLVGRVDDRVWVSAGYSGHGNVLGLACGELVADAILGERDPLLELFDPLRLESR
jgi:glycine/D-amino acid oxidase-like deaminating enzyme